MTALGTLLVKARSSTTTKTRLTSTTTTTTTRKTSNQRQYPSPSRQPSAVLLTHRRFPRMSKALVHELDRKMQQMKEYALITHGYHNENFQYPIHVRRSHDGEKHPRTLPSTFSRTSRSHRLMKSPILTLSSQENQNSSTNSTTKSKSSTKSSENAITSAPSNRTFVAPPNRTINDIDPALNRDQSSYTTGPALTRLYFHRKSSSSSLTSSPKLSSSRPHSIACLSTTETIISNTSDSNESCTTTTITVESSSTSSNSTLIPTHDDEQSTTHSPFNSSSQSLINQSASRTPIRTMTQKFFSKLFHHPSKSS